MAVFNTSILNLHLILSLPSSAVQVDYLIRLSESFAKGIENSSYTSYIYNYVKKIEGIDSYLCAVSTAKLIA